MSDTQKKVRRTFQDRFDKLFTALTFVMFPLSFMLAGININEGDVDNIVINLVLGVFWGGVLVITHFSRIAKVQLDGVEENIKVLGKIIEVAEAAKKLADGHTIDDHLMSIIDRVTGGNRPPRTDEIEQIQRLFHEETGLHAKLTLVAGGLHMEISKDPKAPQKARKPAQKRPHSKSEARRVAVQKAAAKKPAAKQRKPLTAEQRERQNAARRAKRAAARKAKK